MATPAPFARLIARMREYVLRHSIVHPLPIGWQQTPQGIVPPPFASEADYPHPWRCRRKIDPVSKERGVTIRMGLVKAGGASYIPEIDGDPMSATDSENFFPTAELTGEAGLICLKVNGDFGVGTEFGETYDSAEFFYQTGTEQPADTDTECYLPIAYDGLTTIVQMAYWNVGVRRAGPVGATMEWWSLA